EEPVLLGGLALGGARRRQRPAGLAGRWQLVDGRAARHRRRLEAGAELAVPLTLAQLAEHAQSEREHRDGARRLALAVLLDEPPERALAPLLGEGGEGVRVRLVGELEPLLGGECAVAAVGGEELAGAHPEAPAAARVAHGAVSMGR